MFSMYRIGEFSTITGLSIRTLRYYDNFGLLKPCFVDGNNYRYYSDRQVLEVKIILLLKDVGFSLEEIKLYWGSFSDEVFLKKRRELVLLKKGISNKIDKLDYLCDNFVDGSFCIDGVKVSC